MFPKIMEIVLKKSTNKNPLIENIKSVGIVLRPDTPELSKEFSLIKSIFIKNNINVLLEENSASMINYDEESYSIKELSKNVDFILSLGGDGTLLSVIRQTIDFSIPILGINLGNLGFLTDIKIENFEEFLNEMLKGNYRIDRRMMIEGNIKFNSFNAFNDIVISRKSISSMIKIKAYINGKLFNTYYGDGVVISSPSGSTAYNLSLGGPIVYPLTEAFIITPIASHSLTQRPLVMPVEFEIEFEIIDSQGAVVIVDGQDIYEVEEKQKVKIKISDKKANMIHNTDRNFFEVLNEKLRWGN